MITTKQATEGCVPLEIISWSPATHKQTTFWDHFLERPVQVFLELLSAGNISATVTSAWMTDGGYTGIHM